MSEENNYVTHSQLHKRELELYRYVDSNYKELEKLYHKLDKKIDIDRETARHTLEKQDKMIKGIDLINTNLTKFDKRVTKIEDKTQDNTDKIGRITEITGNKKDNIVKVIIAIITTLGVIISAALGFAQVFF